MIAGCLLSRDCFDCSIESNAAEKHVSRMGFVFRIREEGRKKTPMSL